jgi:predicted nucleotidyltransferase
MDMAFLHMQYRSKILEIANKYKAENIRIFGSTVRGENTKDSDVDFLVHFKKRGIIT